MLHWSNFSFPDDFEPSENASDDEETIEKEEEEADGDEVSPFLCAPYYACQIRMTASEFCCCLINISEARVTFTAVCAVWVLSVSNINPSGLCS